MNIFLICGRWQFSQGLNLEILHRTSWEAQEEKEEEVNLQIIWSVGSNPAAVPSIKAGGGEAFGSLAPGSQPWFSFKLLCRSSHNFSLPLHCCAVILL